MFTMETFLILVALEKGSWKPWAFERGLGSDDWVGKERMRETCLANMVLEPHACVSYLLNCNSPYSFIWRLFFSVKRILIFKVLKHFQVPPSQDDWGWGDFFLTPLTMVQKWTLSAPSIHPFIWYVVTTSCVGDFCLLRGIQDMVLWPWKTCGPVGVINK